MSIGIILLAVFLAAFTALPGFRAFCLGFVEGFTKSFKDSFVKSFREAQARHRSDDEEES